MHERPGAIWHGDKLGVQSTLMLVASVARVLVAILVILGALKALIGSPRRVARHARGETREGIATLHQTLMAHATHQDNLLWGRIQTLVAIQAASIAASYAMRETRWLASSIMMAAALFTVVVVMFVKLDAADRNINFRLMDELAKMIVPVDVARAAGLPADAEYVVGFTAPRKAWRPKARQLLYVAFTLFIVADLLLAAAYICWPTLFVPHSGA